jgi:putative hydrolase of the HAD superfamily
MDVRRSIETVFLDAGGVLVYPNWHRVADAFARQGLLVDADLLRRAEPAARFAIDNPRADTSSDADRGGRYFNHVLDSAGVPRGAARNTALAEVYAYHMEHNLWEQVPDDVVPALTRLRAAGLKLAVASNANGVLERCLDRIELSQFFDVICDSALEGVEKPDPRFFRILLERTGSRADSTLHVGDLYHVDVLGARNAGLHPLLLDRDNLYVGFDVERVTGLDQVAAIVTGGLGGIFPGS